MKTAFLIFFYIGILGFSGAYAQQNNWPEVSKFQFSQSGSNMKLQWLVVAEPQGFYYEIERSEDGLTYKPVGIVLGGFEQEGLYAYKFQENVKGTKIYYRIKQVKQDGSFRIIAEHSV